LIVAHPASAPRADGRLRVDFLDVGQGDAALLTLPDGSTLLVDAGGRPRFGARAQVPGEAEPFERDARGVGERVVSEFLWHRGVDRVDYLLATHAHADHMEGLKDVARNFTVRAALVGRAPEGVAAYDEFAAALREAGVPLRLVGRGDVLRAGGVTLEVLWPPPLNDEGAAGSVERGGAAGSVERGGEAGAHESAAPRRSPGGAAGAGRESPGNDDSVVLRVRYGERCLLLTGDIESAAEGALVAAGDDLRCDVVKVAHHGSKTSSSQAFVAATRARYAVVPVGLDSPFGHPDAGVVARWRGAGAEVLRTGRRGAITVSTDGRDLRVETFVRE
jgi:competence protein ComEC